MFITDIGRHRVRWSSSAVNISTPNHPDHEAKNHRGSAPPTASAQTNSHKWPDRCGRPHQCRSWRAWCANDLSRRETRPDVSCRSAQMSPTRRVMSLILPSAFIRPYPRGLGRAHREPHHDSYPPVRTPGNKRLGQDLGNWPLPPLEPRVPLPPGGFQLFAAPAISLATRGGLGQGAGLGVGRGGERLRQRHV